MKNLIIIYLVVNLIVFAMYGLDKWKAARHKWRIPEKILLAGAVFGVIGALAGMFLFHHKTRKAKFIILVPILFLGELALAIYLFTRVF